MALSRSKYKRIPDLYTMGTEVVLKDGTVLWMQVLNPFEVDEARHDAQVARSRIVKALKGEHGSDERLKVEGAYYSDGHDVAVTELADARTQEKLVDIVGELRDDPEWTERLEIVDRSEDILFRAPEDAERKLLDQINNDYVKEVMRRQDDERAFQLAKLKERSDQELLEDYVDHYVQRRGGELALAEYALTEVWYAARVCEGERRDDGGWDHSKCESHQLQVYEGKAELRRQPEELQDVLVDAMRTLTMTVREAKNSARQESSSASSPLPSEPVESTPSTPDVTPGAVPGP